MTRTSKARSQSTPQRRPMVVGKGWVQGVVLVMLFGFTIMGAVTWSTYTDSMPIPQKVTTTSGQELFSQADITAGQVIFQNRGLMEYGSIVGHGGYLGPDFTADYLRRAADHTLQLRQKSGVHDPTEANKADWRTNRYDEKTGVLVFSPEQASAYSYLVGYYTDYFGKNSHNLGLLADNITDPVQAKQLTSFFAWTAWAAAANRPGHDYSYTNNWPSESRVDNGPTADMVLWSALSLIVLIGGTGIMFAIYGRWSRKIGWHESEVPTLSFIRPRDVGLTKSQRVCSWFFLVIAALFLMQTICGAAAEHYRSDLTSFFGFDLASWFPYNLARTWPAPGTSSSPCSGRQRPSWPVASSWRRSSPVASPGTRAGGPGYCSAQWPSSSSAPWRPRCCPSTGCPGRAARSSASSGSTSTCPECSRPC